MTCAGGLTDFPSNDGSQRLIEIHQEMEEAFPLYHSNGLPMSPAQTRFLSVKCMTATEFSKADGCGNGQSCSGCGDKLQTAKCKGRQLKCKGSGAGISFPFLKGTHMTLQYGYLTYICLSYPHLNLPVYPSVSSHKIRQVALAYFQEETFKSWTFGLQM